MRSQSETRPSIELATRQVSEKIDTTALDFTSATWQNIRKWIVAKRIEARKRNDSLKVSPEKTIEIRAKIAVYNEILGLDRN